MSLLENIIIVLVEPSHPGNIGAVARAMKTMGLMNLAMVNPRKFPHVEASARAAGADDVLQNAVVTNDIKKVIADCTLVLGTSVRERQVTWPMSNPNEAAQIIDSHLETISAIDQSNGVEENTSKVAILFGRENSGLSNEEMDLCSRQICIPANEDYSSLNLASAVQIIAYELRMRSLITSAIEDNNAGDVDANNEKPLSPLEKRQQIATKEQFDGHMQHLADTMEKLSFIKSGPSTMLMRKLTRLYNKAELTVEEIQILRGILAAMQDHLPK